MSTVFVVSVRRRARRLLCGVVLLSTTACHVSRVEPLVPTTAFGRADHVIITKVDGSSVAMVDARIANDSLVGIWAGSSTRLAVPVAEVRTVTVRRLSTDRTVLTVVGVAAVAAILVKAIHDEASKPVDICVGC